MNLREKRKEKNMTQVDLAKAVGTNQSSITRFETGLATPKPATAKRIAAVLDFDWTEFYEEAGDGSSQPETGIAARK